MSSIFQRALGEDFHRLHPMLQKRFGVGVAAGYACIGRGTFTEVTRGPWWTLPFLYLGAFRNILFPTSGTNVPFTIENYPYIDGFGRETVTFVRTLRVGRRRERRFDATMIHSAQRNQVIDYLGSHQHLATGLDLEVLPDGSLHLTSGTQRFYEGPVHFTVPPLLTGTAELQETYDDARGPFTVRMEVRNPLFGLLFGYRGEFTCEFLPVSGRSVPEALLPVREESRE